MVHIRPSVSRGFPSTISCAPMFSRWTRISFKKVSDLSTFSRQWILILPLVGFGWNTHNDTAFILYQTHTSRCTQHANHQSKLTLTLVSSWPAIKNTVMKCWSPHLARSHYCQQLNLSVPMSVCPSQNFKLLLFRFSVESSHFLAVSSPWPPLQNFVLRFLCTTAYMLYRIYAMPIPSVRPSVTRVRCGKTAERIIEILSPSDRPIILVFRHQGRCVMWRLHPQQGRQIQGGSNFRPICGYISETVIDRGNRIVTMEDEYKVACALSNSANFDDLEWPRTPVSRSQYSLRRISCKRCIRSIPCLVLG